MTDITVRIRQLMEQNKREVRGQRFTVPSPELYPFQWLWDSCFHAIILRHFDVARARDELRAALTCPLPDGLLPHIIYWSDDYRVTNWGRERRGDIITNGWGTKGTSSLTQPPIIAEAVRLVLKSEWDEAFLREAYPKLKAYYVALIRERDIHNRGLLGIINPDESGEDNSPRFDALLGLSAIHTNDEHLDKRIGLMQHNVACKLETRCMQEYFWVEDVPFNAIAVVGFEAMATLAEKLAYHDDAGFFREKAGIIASAMRMHMLADSVFKSLQYDHGIRTPIPTETWALFSPLYAGIASDEEAIHIVEHFLTNEEKFWTLYGIPSTALSDPTYQKDGFWRGPTWMAVNWFIYAGLLRYDFSFIAEEVRAKSLALIELSGFREQYDPLSGEGFGAHDFTWGGLVIDMIAHPEKRTGTHMRPQK